MKTGDTMRFWEVLAEAEDDTTIVVEGLDNHLHISNPNALVLLLNKYMNLGIKNNFLYIFQITYGIK